MPAQINKASWPERIRLLSHALAWLIVLLIIIVAFVPFSPAMPAADLDPSWKYGLNQAMAQGLSFGKDIIFTYGPYASIYTKLYHPSTDSVMMGGSLYLALSYWAGLIIVMKGVQWRWIVMYCVILAGMMYLPDPLLFSFPFLAGLAIFKILSMEDSDLIESRLAPLYVAILFAPFGLLPLIKGSLFILCGAVAALCSLYFVVNRQRILALICLISPLISIPLFWIISGQSAAALPEYFIARAPIVSGYTEAMATNGPAIQIIAYVGASILVLIALSVQPHIAPPSKIFLLFLYGMFLFISFKAGFVRHDGHAVIAGTAIIIATLCLPCLFSTRMILLLLLMAGFAWFQIDRQYIHTTPNAFRKNVLSIYSSAWKGFNKRIENPNWPGVRFDAAVNAIRTQASFPVLQGTTDIYSYNQSYVIASGNIWSPRPIFQSYSVYTPELAEINRRHLLGNGAPDNIIFSVEPIDGRLPAMEDGASWPILLSNYQPTRMENNFLFLRKKDPIAEMEVPVRLSSGTHMFGEHVNVPGSGQFIFAQIEISPTIWGRIANILFKPNQLNITLELTNGIKKQFRLVTGMAKSNVLISPLIETTTEFHMLFGEKSFLDGKLVKSLAITPSHGITMLWSDEYTILFNQLQATSSPGISLMDKGEEFDDA